MKKKTKKTKKEEIDGSTQIMNGDKIHNSKVKISIKLFIALIVSIITVVSFAVYKYQAIENEISNVNKRLENNPRMFHGLDSNEKTTSKELMISYFDSDCQEIQNAIGILNYFKQDKNCQ